MVNGIFLENVTKKIGKNIIVENVSFNTKEGEILGLLGMNGAGKTTIIRAITGLISITSGEVYIDGYSISEDREKAISKIGAIIENPDFYNYMSGYNNLKYFSKLQSLKINNEEIDEIVKLVGLSNSINKKVKTYSLGMKQRLGLAQSLLNKPKFLILDEPTNGLDPAGIIEFRNYIKNIAKAKKMSIIISSHQLSEIELICDSVVILQEGKLINTEKISKNTTTENLSKAKVLIELNEPIVAQSLIKSKYPEVEIGIENNGLFITGDNDKISDIVKYLITNNVDVYRIKDQHISLEERFLNLTGKE